MGNKIYLQIENIKILKSTIRKIRYIYIMKPEKLHKCVWLPAGKTQRCENKCSGDYCIIHVSNAKRGSKGPQPCIVCGIGVRGKYPLCVAHGSRKYRTLALYYQTYHCEDLSVHDYVKRFNIGGITSDSRGIGDSHEKSQHASENLQFNNVVVV